MTVSNCTGENATFAKNIFEHYSKIMAKNCDATSLHKTVKIIPVFFAPYEYMTKRQTAYNTIMLVMLLQ